MDLSLIPIQNILDELDRRFDANVVLTCKIKDKNVELHEFHQFGGHFVVLGMCEQMAFSLKEGKEKEITDRFYED